MVYFSFFDLRESLLSLKEVLNFYDAQGRFRFQAKNQSYGYAHYSLRNAAGEEAGVIKRNPRGGVIYQWDNGVSVGPAIVTKLGRDFYDIYRNGKLFTSICLNPDMKSFVKSPFLLERIDWKIRRDWLLRNHQRPRRMYRPHESEHFGLCRRRKNRDSRLCRSCDSVEPADCGRESFYLWLQVNKKEFSRVTDLCKTA